MRVSTSSRGSRASMSGSPERFVEAPALPDRLPGDEPDRRRVRPFPAHDEDVDEPILPAQLAHPVGVRLEVVLERASPRAADLVEVRRHEPVVEDDVELMGDRFARAPDRGRDLQVGRGGLHVSAPAGAEESVEAASRGLAAVGVRAHLLFGRSGPRLGRRRDRKLRVRRDRRRDGQRQAEEDPPQALTHERRPRPRPPTWAAATETLRANGESGGRAGAAVPRDRAAAARTPARRSRARARS